METVDPTLPPGGIGSDARVGGTGAFKWLFDPYGFGVSSRTTSDFFSHLGIHLDIQPMFVLLFVVDQSTPSRAYSALSSAKPSSASSRVLAG
jgi:hypothetical protein